MNEQDEKKDKITKVINNKQNESISNMETVEMIVLLYRAERIGGWNDQDIIDYEMNISKYFST